MWWIILLIIFALIFLFFWQSLHIVISYDGEFKLIAGLGLIWLDVLKLFDKFIENSKKDKPKKEKKEKDKEEKPKEEKKEPEEEQPAKPNVFKEVIELRGFDGAIDLLSEFASLLGKFGNGLAKHFVIRKITVDYAVCGDDAADTAIKFGAISASIFSLLGVIGSYSKIKKRNVNITADYTGSEDSQNVYIHMSYRLLSLIAVALAALKDFLQIMRREKSINARIRARSKARQQKAVQESVNS